MLNRLSNYVNDKGQDQVNIFKVYELLYRLGLDGISACFCSSILNQSPSVPYRYINKLPISSLKFVHYAYDI